MSKKIGLALGSGGARGIAHIGVLKELEKNKIKIDFLSACSMGALIGAYYALEGDIKELEKIALSFNKKRALNKIIDLNWPKNSLIKGKKIYAFIKELVQDKKFSDTNIPFKIISTDLKSGKEIILEDGKLADAIMASISVPGIFPPVKIKEKYLLDGGLVNPTPIDTVKEMGSDLIIGVDFFINNQEIFNKPTLFNVLMQSYEIIREMAVKNKLQKNKNLFIIKPEIRNTIDSFKFHKIEKFIVSGEKAAQKEIPKIKKAISEIV